MHYRFQVNVYQRPTRLVIGEQIVLRGLHVAPLCEDDGRPPTFDQYLPTTFEEAVERLAQLPQLDVEPDGFFVHSGIVDSIRWQLDGHLYDFGDWLHRVQLHGDCPGVALDSVLDCIGRQAVGASLAFELVQEGVALDEDAFLRWAAANSE